MNDIIFNILKEGNDGGNLYNYGTISANNNININAEDSIYNGLAMGSSARISSNNNVTLIANNKIINKGYIQTTGNNPDSRLILETRAEINSNYKLANYDLERLNDGSMDSLTDEYLKSLRINSINTNLTEKTGIHNYGRIYSNTDMELNSNSILHNNKGALIYSNNDIFFNINKVLFNNENNLGQGIYANNNIDIFGYTSDSYLENLINYDGRIESKSDINIKTNNLINYGSDNYDLSNIDTEPNVELYKYSYGGLLGRPTTNIFGAYGVDNSKIPTGAYQILSNYYGEQDAAFNGKLLEYEEYAVVSNVISNPSAIRSGNSLNIDNKNNLINKNSSINSKDIDIETNNLLNYLTSFIVTTHSRYNERGYFCGGKCNVDTKYYTNNILYSQTPSEIIASGDLNVKAKNLKGGGTIEKQDLENLEGQNLVVAKQETKFEEISKTGTLNPLDNAQLPEGDYGIFRKPQNPNSHYLFETDPTLIDISKFLGSEYFMNRLGLDPNSVDLKFIGDSYFEHDLLKRTLENLSNTNSALKSTPSEEITDRINQMYENIDQDLQNRLGLKFGESLTEEQLANLDRDIIWYVKQDIALPDGTIVKDVLVPQIYLSKNNRELLEQNINILNSTGSIIAGTNINLNIENNLTNSNNSTIVANNNLNINAGNDINNLNGSTIKTLNESGILQLIAGNDINNIGANISAQNDLSISAGNDINNITLTQRNYDGKNSENSKMSYHDSILNESTIESKNHAIISAKNNINIQGASTQSENDLYINAENGNINISTAQLESFSEQKSGDGGDTYHKMNQAIKNKESNIASKNGTTHLQASGTDSTNGNINIIGSNIYGEDGVNLIADNNVNVLSSVDMEHSYLRQKEENWDGSGSIDINQTITNTNNSSNIVSNNGNINIITGRNTNIVASNLATNESGDINILAGYTVDKDTGNIAQKTDKDGNITTGSINILSTQDLEKNYSYHEEWGGFFDMLANFDIDLDKGGLTLSTSYEQELDENTTLTKTARTSNINANNGSINLNATENILSIGTQIYADK